MPNHERAGGCPAGTHWDPDANACVSDDLILQVYELASQVNYVAVNSAVKNPSDEETLKNTIRILNETLKELKAESSRRK
jgi:hypothetical protein